MTDLAPYIAKGFPGAIDAGIADVGVLGVDRDQAQSMVRLCPETENALYEGNFSPRKIRYRHGSRAMLEKLARSFPRNSPREYAIHAMNWVRDTVIHPHLCGETPPDRALSEEALILSKRGWCNEQTRVFIALCGVEKIPARLCFLHHVNNRCGHTAAEVYLEGRWGFFDTTFALTVTLPDGRLAEARELSEKYQYLANQEYRSPLDDYYRRSLPFVENTPWRKADRPDTCRGGDLFGSVGISNYIIEGVEAAP